MNRRIQIDANHGASVVRALDHQGRVLAEDVTREVHPLNPVTQRSVAFIAAASGIPLDRVIAAFWPAWTASEANAAA